MFSLRAEVWCTKSLINGKGKSHIAVLLADKVTSKWVCITFMTHKADVKVGMCLIHHAMYMYTLYWPGFVTKLVQWSSLVNISLNTPMNVTTFRRSDTSHRPETLLTTLSLIQKIAWNIRFAILHQNIKPQYSSFCRPVSSNSKWVCSTSKPGPQKYSLIFSLCLKYVFTYSLSSCVPLQARLLLDIRTKAMINLKPRHLITCRASFQLINLTGGAVTVLPRLLLKLRQFGLF